MIKMERPQEHLTVIAMWSTPLSDRSIAPSSREPQNSSIEVSLASLPINARDEYPPPRRHHRCQQTWIIADYEREHPFFLRTNLGSLWLCHGRRGSITGSEDHRYAR
ncbi:MAG TPA: hypothetical protein VJY33_08090, partial [Isosphaeraceae bacterium]|nr:hypothetical protein [Isosphaeraceae bacterium]